jgi:hypothetical protein
VARKPIFVWLSVRDSVVGMRRCGCLGAILAVLLVGMLALRANAGPPAEGTGSAPNSAASNGADVVDIGIMVWLQPSDGARVAIACQHPVAHARIKQAVTRLADKTGWAVSNLAIIDDRINRDPITTTAKFTLNRAPQLLNGVPALLPYLQAFQGFNAVEVLFVNVPPVRYRTVDRFDNPALSVQLVEQGQGVLRYDAQIHDHQGTLPALPSVTQAVPTGPPAVSRTPASLVRHTAMPVPGAGFLMLLVGMALLCGTSAYIWLIRRLPARPSARIMRL